MNRSRLLAAMAAGVAFSLPLPALAASGQSTVPAPVETQSCISARLIKKIYVINDFVVVYELSGKKFYRTTFSSRCSGLSRYRGFTTDSVNAFRLCEGDNLLVSLSHASCRLTGFQPITANDLLRLQYAAYLQRQQKEKAAKAARDKEQK